MDKRLTAVLLMFSALPVLAQRGSRESARDLFHNEAGLIVLPGGSRGRFQTARKSTVALTLGLRYRLWKVSGSATDDLDPGAPGLQPGDLLRLGIEINDTGYLYITHRQPTGAWRRVFPDPEIERGNHFVHSGVTYPIPSDEGIELQFPGGVERFLIVLSREPVKQLEALVSPPQPENTVSAAPAPEITEAVAAGVRKLLNSRDLMIEQAADERAVYAVNRSGRPDSLVIAEIRLSSR